MSYSIVSDSRGLSQVSVDDEPNYIVPLSTQPTSLEEPLKYGKWIIVAMSLWSGHDIRAGEQAIEAAKRQQGRIKLGLRLYNYAHENAKWIPGFDAAFAADQPDIRETAHGSRRHLTIQPTAQSSPVWVAMSDGVVLGVWYGQLQDNEIDGMMARAISIPDSKGHTEA